MPMVAIEVLEMLRPLLGCLCNIKRSTWLRVVSVYAVIIFVITVTVASFLHGFLRMPYPEDGTMARLLQTTNRSQLMPQDFPKIFHQTARNDEIPPRFERAYNSCRALNPGYTFMLWTHERTDMFMKLYYPWFWQFFNSYPYRIQKVDVIRYFILYHYGGVYLDIDIECLVPMATVLQEVPPNTEFVLHSTWPVGVATEFIISKQYNSFSVYLISKLQYSNKWYGFHYFTVMASTGPMFLSRCLHQYRHRSSVHVLPAAMFEKGGGDGSGSGGYFLEVKKTRGLWQGWDYIIIGTIYGALFNAVWLFVLVLLLVSKFSNH